MSAAFPSITPPLSSTTPPICSPIPIKPGLTPGLTQKPYPALVATPAAAQSSESRPDTPASQEVQLLTSRVITLREKVRTLNAELTYVMTLYRKGIRTEQSILSPSESKTPDTFYQSETKTDGQSILSPSEPKTPGSVDHTVIQIQEKVAASLRLINAIAQKSIEFRHEEVSEDLTTAIGACLKLARQELRNLKVLVVKV